MAQTRLFPVTVVGSWTRQPWLVAALRQRQAGEISAAEFDAVADDAVLAAIKYQEDAGVDIVADGEMRRDNFYSFVVEKLNGMRLMKLSQLMDYVKDRAGFEEILRALDVPAFAIKSPIAVEKISERDGLCVGEAQFPLVLPLVEIADAGRFHNSAERTPNTLVPAHLEPIH